MNKVIETERLIIRPFVDGDVEAVYEFNSHPEVIKYTGNALVKNLQEAQDIITTIWHRDYKIHGYGRFAVVYKPDNKVIGFSGLKWEADLDATDIGYRFLPEYWGMGIATESCIPILQYGFEELGLDKIVGLALPDNIASCKVLEKIGMHHYKTANFPGEDLMCNWYKKENPESNPIVVTREIKCDKEKIWSAITDINEMKQWYFDQIPSFEAKLGFATEFVIYNEGRTFTHQWSVLDVKPNDTITYSWQYPEYPGRSQSKFSIVESDQGTSITLSCTGLETFPDDIPEFTRESCEGGWNYFLNRLKDYCEK